MAFLTKSLPRRTVLKGLGTTHGAAVPGSHASSHARRRKQPLNRFQAFYVPNGMAMEYWTGGKAKAPLSNSRPSWSRWPRTKNR